MSVANQRDPRHQISEMLFAISDQVGFDPGDALDLRLSYAMALGPDFWAAAGWIGNERRYVDGFNGQCNWNTAVTVLKSVGGVPGGNPDFLSAIAASNLRVFRGYALSPAFTYQVNGEEKQLVEGWYEHTWCMDNHFIIETTGPFRAYYGAAIDGDQILHFVEGLPGPDQLDHGGLGWTEIAGERRMVVADEVQGTIGLPKL